MEKLRKNPVWIQFLMGQENQKKEVRKIESRMQKLLMDQNINFMNKVLNPIEVHQSNEISISKQDESDSQLDRCRLQLQEIQRQQLNKKRQQQQKRIKQQQVDSKRCDCQYKEEIIVEQNGRNGKVEMLLCDQHIVTQIQVPSLIIKNSKCPFIQELNEQQVRIITDSLQLIFDIFKERVPFHDQIEIIRLLYVKYIGPEEQKNEKYSKIKVYENKPQHIIQKNLDPVILNPTTYVTKSIMKMPTIGNYLQIDHIPKSQKPIVIHSIQQKQSYPKRDKQSNHRYFDQQNVAKLFIKHGYGLHVARKYLGENIINNHYTNLITTIIRQTWRRIQDYISRIQKINPMNNNDFKVIKTSLVNCVKWMDSNDIETFYGFVKVAYNLSNNQPYEEEAIKLYNSCIQRYKELRGEYDAQMRVKMEKKFAHQIKGDVVFPSVRQKQFWKIGLMKGNKALSRGPSEDELGDLIGLIKSQLKQTSKNFNHTNSQQRHSIMNSTSIMKLQIPNINLPRQTNSSINGQRR